MSRRVIPKDIQDHPVFQAASRPERAALVRALDWARASGEWPIAEGDLKPEKREHMIGSDRV